MKNTFLFFIFSMLSGLHVMGEENRNSFSSHDDKSVIFDTGLLSDESMHETRGQD